MTQNFAGARTNRRDFVDLDVRVLPNLAVVHDFVADLAGCTGTEGAAIISDQPPGLACDLVPCVKLDHCHPHLQGQ